MGRSTIKAPVGARTENAVLTEPRKDPHGGGATEEWLSARVTCEILGIADRTLRKWARQGQIYREFGPDGHPRYRKADVEKFDMSEKRAAKGSPKRARPKSGRPPGRPRKNPLPAPAPAAPLPSPVVTAPAAASAPPTPVTAPAWTAPPPAPVATAPAPDFARDLTDSRAREKKLREENAWLREHLQRALRAEEDLRSLLLNAQAAEADLRSFFLQVYAEKAGVPAPVRSEGPLSTNGYTSTGSTRSRV